MHTPAGEVLLGKTEHECVLIMFFQLSLFAVCMLQLLICLYLYMCQAAERDWEEKRASLTQFSAQDINRLLEETQAELMKAIPDLDFAARHINKPAVPPKPQITIPITSTTATSSAAGTTGSTATPTASTTTPSSDQQPGKVQLAAQKLNSMEGAGSHRGSGEFFMTICALNSVYSSCQTVDLNSLSFVYSGSQCGQISYRETLQVSASTSTASKLPVGTRPHHQPHRRGHRHQQESEGEIWNCFKPSLREEVSLMRSISMLNEVKRGLISMQT